MLGAVTFLARGSSGPADAHALLVRADPPVNSQLREPPTALTLFFSEPLERSFSSVRVTDQDGNRVEEAVEFDGADDTLMRVSLAELSPGFITVEWETVSTVNGHRITGSSRLPSSTPTAVSPPGRPRVLPRRRRATKPIRAVSSSRRRSPSPAPPTTNHRAPMVSTPAEALAAREARSPHSIISQGASSARSTGRYPLPSI